MGKLRSAIALVVISCGSTPQHTAQPLAGTQVKTYGVLGIKADAKAPQQAVILGTDARNGSTVVPLPITQARANVDAMFVRMGGDVQPTGGLSPVKLSTAPNPDQSVQVGVYEEFAGGTGSQWRAGVWVSAIVAATTLNKDLTDFTFSASSGGYIDGASASGLMTGGFLAAMTGQTIDPTVTMTGIINPDGTIGPVSGIPEKFLGSIAKGKKRLGYPIGMRMSKSEATGQVVDLDELAKSHGAEAVEIADVHEAYRLLTGKQLPEAVPVAESDMALDASTTKALQAKYAGWQKKLGEKWPAIVQLETAGRLPQTLVTMRAYAQKMTEQAEKLHKKGLAAAAYTRIVAAYAYAAAATDTADLLAKLQTGDLRGAETMLEDLSKRGKDSIHVFQDIGRIKPATLGGHLLMMASFEAALEGWVYEELAGRAVTTVQEGLRSLSASDTATLGSPAVADQLATALAPAMLFMERGLVGAEIAREELDFEAETSVNYMCSIPNVRRMATSFESASAAGVNYFDTLLVEPLAQSAHVSADEAKNRIAFMEPTYLVSLLLSKLGTTEGLPKALSTEWGEHSLAWSLFSLAGSELAYFDSAGLIAKYYSLGVHTDEAGKADKVEYAKAFDNMLATAERNARASARAARIATGAIPVQAKLAYQVASVERDGDLGEKLDALAELWVASAMSQTAVMLARN
jgi:hypothetical protein